MSDCKENTDYESLIADMEAGIYGLKVLLHENNQQEQEITRLRGEVERLNNIIDEIAEDCPNCDNSGSYGIGSNSEGWEQVQCEFCYTVKNSRFNIEQLKGSGDECL